MADADFALEDIVQAFGELRALLLHDRGHDVREDEVLYTGLLRDLGRVLDVGMIGVRVAEHRRLQRAAALAQVVFKR